MWLWGWIKSLGLFNRDKVDVLASKYVYTNRKEYQEFKERLEKIKDGDASLYKEIFDLVWGNLPCETKELLSHLLSEIVPQRSIRPIKKSLAIIEKDITPEIRDLYNNIIYGYTISWNIELGKVVVITKPELYKLKNNVCLSQEWLVRRYNILPLEVKTYLSEQLNCIIGIAKNLNNKTPISTSELRMYFKQIAIYIAVVLMQAMPECYDNCKKTLSETSSDLPFFMYYFVTREHGLVKMSSILSSFFTEEAGTDGLYLIRNTMLKLAKYDMGKDYSDYDDWKNMLEEPSSKNRAEMHRALLALVRKFHVKSGQKRNVPQSFEEMLVETCSIAKFKETLLDYLKQYSSDDTHIAILFRMLMENDFFKSHEGNMIKPFFLALRHEMDVDAKERGIYKKYSLLKKVMENPTLSNSDIRSEYYIVSDEWLGRFVSLK